MSIDEHGVMNCYIIHDANTARVLAWSYKVQRRAMGLIILTLLFKHNVSSNH